MRDVSNGYRAMTMVMELSLLVETSFMEQIITLSKPVECCRHLVMVLFCFFCSGGFRVLFIQCVVCAINT